MVKTGVLCLGGWLGGGIQEGGSLISSTCGDIQRRRLEVEREETNLCPADSSSLWRICHRVRGLVTRVEEQRARVVPSKDLGGRWGEPNDQVGDEQGTRRSVAHHNLFECANLFLEGA